MQRLNRMKNLWQASTHKNKLTFENMHFPVTTYGYNLWTISDHKRRKSRPLNLNIRGKTWEHCEIRRNRYSTRSECGRKLAYKQSNVLETSAVVILIITLDLKERWWKVWFPKEKNRGFQADPWVLTQEHVPTIHFMTVGYFYGHFQSWGYNYLESKDRRDRSLARWTVSHSNQHIRWHAYILLKKVVLNINSRTCFRYSRYISEVEWQ